MNTLFTYIKAIHNQESAVSIISKTINKECYIDDGIEVDGQETTYFFDNGATIRHKIERDNVLSEQICEECWITYEVIDANRLSIRPRRKVFYNTCQESFWMKVQAASKRDLTE